MSNIASTVDHAELPDSLPWSVMRNALGQLVYTDAEGVLHAGVVPVRAFPIAAPDEGLSLVGTDGHELHWIERLSALPDAIRHLLQSELAERDFMPVIQSIKAVSTYATPSTWLVATDRGDTTLILKSEDDIRRLSHDTLLIAASSGVQFSLPHLSRLDKQSKRFLERFL